jgi:hypothetical protein
VIRVLEPRVFRFIVGLRRLRRSLVTLGFLVRCDESNVFGLVRGSSGVLARVNNEKFSPGRLGRISRQTN